MAGTACCSHCSAIPTVRSGVAVPTKYLLVDIQGCWYHAGPQVVRSGGPINSQEKPGCLKIGDLSRRLNQRSMGSGRRQGQGGQPGQVSRAEPVLYPQSQAKCNVRRLAKSGIQKIQLAAAQSKNAAAQIQSCTLLPRHYPFHVYMERGKRSTGLGHSSGRKCVCVQAQMEGSGHCFQHSGLLGRWQTGVSCSVRQTKILDPRVQPYGKCRSVHLFAL